MLRELVSLVGGSYLDSLQGSSSSLDQKIQEEDETTNYHSKTSITSVSFGSRIMIMNLKKVHCTTKISQFQIMREREGKEELILTIESYMDGQD